MHIPTLAFLAVLGANSKREYTLDMETRDGGISATQSVAVMKWET